MPIMLFGLECWSELASDITNLINIYQGDNCSKEKCIHNNYCKQILPTNSPKFLPANQQTEFDYNSNITFRR